MRLEPDPVRINDADDGDRNGKDPSGDPRDPVEGAVRRGIKYVVTADSREPLCLLGREVFRSSEQISLVGEWAALWERDRTGFGSRAGANELMRANLTGGCAGHPSGNRLKLNGVMGTIEIDTQAKASPPRKWLLSWQPV